MMDTDDVLQWLNSHGLEAFGSGFQGASFCLLFKIESPHEKILTEKKRNASLLVKKIYALNLNMHKKASCHNRNDSASTDEAKHLHNQMNKTKANYLRKSCDI